MPELRFSSVVALAFVGFSLVGCGGGGSGTGGTGGSGGTTSTSSTGGSGGATSTSTGTTFAPMVLTSPVLSEGGMFAADNTCAGKNESPQLDWTAGPPGTLSYSLVFRDKSNNLIHAAMWDIPKEVLELPANVEKAQKPANVPGAKQAKAYDDTTFGYLGPCPQGNLHDYEFTLYALNAATLPVIGFPDKQSIEDVSLEHKLASATLGGQSDAKP